MVTRSAVDRALATVRDPELDEAVTELGFVSSVDIEGGRVGVRLRLPTYFCAANFAYLMVADALQAVRGVDGVEEVEVALDDHYASSEITAGVAGGNAFADTFAGLADGELDELRLTFRRKAFMARHGRLCRSLLAEARDPADLAGMTVGDLPAGRDTDVYLQRRAELGIATSGDAPLLVDAHGQPVTDVEAHLRWTRTVGVSIEGNAGFCRGLLRTRYEQLPVLSGKERA